jgi:hypothetical protein
MSDRATNVSRGNTTVVFGARLDYSLKLKMEIELFLRKVSNRLLVYMGRQSRRQCSYTEWHSRRQYSYTGVTLQKTVLVYGGDTPEDSTLIRGWHSRRLYSYTEWHSRRQYSDTEWHSRRQYSYTEWHSRRQYYSQSAPPETFITAVAWQTSLSVFWARLQKFPRSHSINVRIERAIYSPWSG